MLYKKGVVTIYTKPFSPHPYFETVDVNDENFELSALLEPSIKPDNAICEIYENNKYLQSNTQSNILENGNYSRYTSVPDGLLNGNEYQWRFCYYKLKESANPDHIGTTADIVAQGENNLTLNPFLLAEAETFSMDIYNRGDADGRFRSVESFKNFFANGNVESVSDIGEVVTAQTTYPFRVESRKFIPYYKSSYVDIVLDTNNDNYVILSYNSEIKLKAKVIGVGREWATYYGYYSYLQKGRVPVLYVEEETNELITGERVWGYEYEYLNSAYDITVYNIDVEQNIDIDYLKIKDNLYKVNSYQLSMEEGTSISFDYKLLDSISKDEEILLYSSNDIEYQTSPLYPFTALSKPQITLYGSTIIDNICNSFQSHFFCNYQCDLPSDSTLTKPRPIYTVFNTYVYDDGYKLIHSSEKIYGDEPIYYYDGFKSGETYKVECNVFDSYDRWATNSLIFDVDYTENEVINCCNYNNTDGSVEIELPSNKNVSKYYVLRQDLENKHLEKVGFIKYLDSGIVVNESIKDYSVRNTNKYKFYIFGCNTDKVLSAPSGKAYAAPNPLSDCVYVSNEITINEKSYYIYDMARQFTTSDDNMKSLIHYTINPNNAWKIEYNLESGDYSQNLNVEYQESFGRYQKANSKGTSFIKSNFKGLLSNGCEVDISPTTADKWYKFAESNSKKLLKDPFGQVFIVSIDGSSLKFYDTINENVCTINGSFTEVEDVHSCYINDIVES